MRVLMKVQTPVERGNKTIQDGSMKKNIQKVIEKIKPEAVYFLLEDGVRTSLWFFDLPDVSQLPSICEPIFEQAHSKITITPTMNMEDLTKGLSNTPK